MNALKAVKKIQDVGQDDDKKERNVSINMKFKLVDLNIKGKKQKEDMKYTQVILTRVSPDNLYFTIRLVRNLSQCLHVDFSEKKKKQEEGEPSEDDEDDKGVGMGIFQGGSGDNKEKDGDDIIPHKIQQMKYHLVVGQMENFLYEYEKLFQLNEDFTISPVINPRLTIGADIEPKKPKPRTSLLNTRDSGNYNE